MQTPTARRRLAIVFLCLLLVVAAVAQQVLTIQGEDPAGVRRIVATNTSGEIITAAGSVVVTNTVEVEGGDADGVAITANPVLTGRADSAGDLERDFVCDQSEVILLAGAGTTEIVPLAAGEVIYICHISISWNASVSAQLVQGTGADCVNGQTDLTGDYLAIGSLSLDLGPEMAIRGVEADAACVTQVGAGDGGGTVIFAQR